MEWWLPDSSMICFASKEAVCAQVYLYTGRGGFKVMERKEVERQAQARAPACLFRLGSGLSLAETLERMEVER